MEGLKKAAGGGGGKTVKKRLYWYIVYYLIVGIFLQKLGLKPPSPLLRGACRIATASFAHPNIRI